MANGFVACRTLNGTGCVLQEFNLKVDATNSYYAGDPVALDSAGQAILVTASVTANFLGVIDSVYLKPASDLDPPKPLTFNQPTRGPFITTGQTAIAKVNVNPGQLYAVEIDVSASAGLIGQTVHVSAGAPNQNAGISGFSLRGASLGTGAENPFKIVSIDPFSKALNGSGDQASGNRVLVQPNPGRNIFNQGTGV